MKILEKKNQNRRDFDAVLICEHCDSTQEAKGCYDDAFFHANVIPAIKCKTCGKGGSEDYVPMATKYHKDQIV